MEPVVHRRGEGERHALGPSETVIKATADDTGGTFFLAESVVAPGFPGPPPHRHERLHDMFYVLEGTLTMRVGEETVEIGPGGFVGVPPGVVHAFSNPGPEPARFLNFNTPGGWERYMRDLAAASAAGTPPTPEEIMKIAARYDIRPA